MCLGPCPLNSWWILPHFDPSHSPLAHLEDEFVRDTCWHVSVTNFASRWATGEYEGSNQGKILPGIQWTWSQTCDMCLSLANTCPLLTLPPDELQRTTWTIISLVVSNIILFSSFASKGGGDLQGLAPHAHDLPQKMFITVKLCAFYVYF